MTKKPNPPGTTIEYEGMYYRIGAHDFIYRWSTNDEWVRSAVPIAKVRGWEKVAEIQAQFDFEKQVEE